MITVMHLAVIFSLLSISSFGGGQTILPSLYQYTVIQHHWLTAREFSDIYALGLTLPGPNTLFVPLIGMKVAGIVGCIVATLAFFVPSSVLMLLFFMGWRYFEKYRFHQIISQAIIPVMIGVLFACGVIIAKAADTHVKADVLILLLTLILLIFKRNPLYILIVSIAAGYYLL